MTGQNLKHANELSRSLAAIHKLRQIFCVPYPEVIYTKHKKKLLFRGFADSDDTICLVELDPDTLKAVKDAMHEVLDRRYEEVRNEFDNL